MIKALPQFFGYEPGRPEIHVGNPHGNNIPFSEFFVSQIIFDRIAAFPVDLFVKIPLHLNIIILRGFKDRYQNQISFTLFPLKACCFSKTGEDLPAEAFLTCKIFRLSGAGSFPVYRIISDTVDKTRDIMNK
jgi:hypothetical protein